MKQEVITTANATRLETSDAITGLGAVPGIDTTPPSSFGLGRVLVDNDPRLEQWIDG